MNAAARWWSEFVAGLGDLVGLPMLLLILLLSAAAVSLVWSLWPWLRQARLSRVRWRRRKRAAPAEAAPADEELDALEPDALPDVPAATFLSRADQFAAQGRFAEAVRERLRAVVRLLVDRRVIDHHPGWTVTELAAEAGRAAPATDRPLGAAGTIFSDIWYGAKPATADDDSRMKQLSSDVDAAVAGGARIPASRRAAS